MNDSVSLLAVTQTVGVFTAFLPRIQDVRKADPNDPNSVRDVRSGEFAAVAIALSIGVLGASITKSVAPLVAAGIICIVEVALYESLLNEVT